MALASTISIAAVDPTISIIYFEFFQVSCVPGNICNDYIGNFPKMANTVNFREIMNIYQNKPPSMENVHP
jgi:hypothetical protein